MKNKVITLFFFFVLAFVGLVAVVAVWLYVLKFGFGMDAITGDIERWGQTGDFFGGVLNPLFAMVTIFALIITIRQNEVAVQQSSQELELSRKEMARSADASQLHADIADRQRFESTFFSLLKLLGDIVNSLELRSYAVGGEANGPSNLQQTSTHGRRVFSSMYATFKRNFASKAVKHLPDKERYERELIDSYLRHYGKVDHVIGHYFRTLYNIIKFVDESNVEDKEFYVKLVRAQLSTDELLLLFYNCLTKLGAPKMRPYVAKYELLKHLERSELVNVEADVDLLVRHFTVAHMAN